MLLIALEQPDPVTEIQEWRSISGMDITPERSKQVSFTTPYYENSAVVIAKKDTYKTFADLKGKRIGMENGTTHQKFVQDQHPEVKTVSYDSYQNAFIDLKNGRIDGVFGDTAVVNEWLKTDPQLGVATEKVTDPQYFGHQYAASLYVRITKLCWKN
ncbi:transporter substrate-binding domain-containing protein [Escherichia coli]